MRAKNARITLSKKPYFVLEHLTNRNPELCSGFRSNPEHSSGSRGKGISFDARGARACYVSTSFYHVAAKMFASFVMSRMGPKGCQQSYFIVGISTLVSGNTGRQLLKRKVDLQYLVQK